MRLLPDLGVHICSQQIATSICRRTLITDAAKELEKSKMARFDERSGNLYVTELGRVASHFYISHASIVTFNEMLSKHMDEAKVHQLAADV